MTAAATRPGGRHAMREREQEPQPRTAKAPLECFLNAQSWAALVVAGWLEQDRLAA